MRTMNAKFAQHELVRVVAQPPRVKDALVDRQGMVVGQSEPYCTGERDYAVHFDHLGQVRVVPEALLRSEGKEGRLESVMTRSSVHPRGQRRVPRPHRAAAGVTWGLALSNSMLDSSARCVQELQDGLTLWIICVRKDALASQEWLAWCPQDGMHSGSILQALSA